MNVPDLDHLSTPSTVLAILVGVLSVGRTARFLIFDDFPPMALLRKASQKFLAHRAPRWLGITECPFCIAPYLVAGQIAWAYYSNLHWTWWLANGWWAASYAAAILVAYDEGVT